ncbi:MAG TPA: hypothetical protein VF691_14670, partial [Cytophagaceae bacterium]
IKFDHLTNHPSLLSLEYSSGNRENFKLTFLDDDVIYLGNIITNNDILTGVMYSKFNFALHKVEKVRIFELNDSLKNEINFTKQPIRGNPQEENWINYNLTHFLLDKNEKVVLVLEKREILSTELTYNSSSVNDYEKWGEKKAFVITGGILMVSFNANDELLWKNFHNKSQKADVSTGLISTSFVLDNSEQGRLRMLYTTSDSPTGIFNVIKYVVWDEITGEVLKDQTLPNEENIGLIRDYTMWWDNKLVLVGRKGLMGKKSFLHLYRI